MAQQVLPFETTVIELLERVRELRRTSGSDLAMQQEVRRVEVEANEAIRRLFQDLAPMERVLLSRHAGRPFTLDYVQHLFTDWIELHGDRRFGDDSAIVGGFARFQGRSIVVVGHQRGRTTKENVKRNFGMPNPEGYRKATRLFELADRFGLPIFTFIDTPGAYPGIGAEERGQSEAIGASIAQLARVRVPVIATIIGEGGSGGALALGVANHVYMLEFASYGVISPEGCSTILWKDVLRAPEAAMRMKMTPDHLLAFKVIDGVIKEPPGGAHHDHEETAAAVGETLDGALKELLGLSPDELRRQRYERFRAIGVFQRSA